MRKVKKLILGAVFGALSMFTLTGCYGREVTLNLPNNSPLTCNFNLKNGFLKGTTQHKNEKFYVYDKEFTLIRNMNEGGFIDLDFLLGKDNYIANQEIQIGEISNDFAGNPNDPNDEHYTEIRDGVFDLGLNIEIFEGFTLEDIWNKNIGNIQNRWKAQEVYKQYKNGTQEEKEAIIKKYRPEFIFTINFDAPVVCEYGQEYVTINGNQAVINIGDMLADNGGYVRLNSSKINKDGVIAPIPNKVIDKYKNKSVMGFNDVKENDWFAKSVEYAVTNKVMTGYGNGKFGANDNVTFAQLAKIMSNAGMNSNSSHKSLNLDHWANDALSWCIDKELFIPSDLQENGSFSIAKLDAPMTREQAIYSMSKFASVIKSQKPNGKEISIPDIMSVNEKYRDEIKLAYQYGITSGTDKNNTFSPTKAVKRAEVCQMFYNMKW